MVLEYIKKSIAQKIGVKNPKDIGLDFSFAEDSRMKEDDFFALLEELEEEMQVELVHYSWKFENLRQLVDYINRH